MKADLGSAITVVDSCQNLQHDPVRGAEAMLIAQGRFWAGYFNLMYDDCSTTIVV